MPPRLTDTRSLLSHLPVFQGLGAAELDRIAAGTSRRVLKRGEVLFRRGDAPTGFYLVIFGRIALTAPSARGGTRVADIVEHGRSFGEAVMFLDKPCIVGASALADSLVLHVAKQTVFAEIERSPAFARRIIAALCAKLAATVRELDTYSLASGGRRFASWLLRSVPDAGPATITLPAAKRAIASKLNLSAEHLSRVLRELSTDGLIEVRGRKVRIPDTARLRAWSAQP